jgi:hypothetical protein
MSDIESDQSSIEGTFHATRYQYYTVPGTSTWYSSTGMYRYGSGTVVSTCTSTCTVVYLPPFAPRLPIVKNNEVVDWLGGGHLGNMY